MAYSSTNPPALTAGPVAGLHGQRWVYSSTNSIETVQGSSFIANGGALGMRAYDEVLVVDLGSSRWEKGRVTQVTTRGATIAVVGGVESDYTLTTTDNNAATLASLTPGLNTRTLLTAYVKAIRTGGTAGVANDAAGYVLHAAAQDVAGTARIIGQSAALVAEDQGGWAAAFDVAGAAVRLRVTGSTGNTVDWTGKIFAY